MIIGNVYKLSSLLDRRLSAHENLTLCTVYLPVSNFLGFWAVGGSKLREEHADNVDEEQEIDLHVYIYIYFKHVQTKYTCKDRDEVIKRGNAGCWPHLPSVCHSSVNLDFLWNAVNKLHTHEVSFSVLRASTDVTKVRECRHFY